VFSGTLYVIVRAQYQVLVLLHWSCNILYCHKAHWSFSRKLL